MDGPLFSTLSPKLVKSLPVKEIVDNATRIISNHQTLEIVDPNISPQEPQEVDDLSQELQEPWEWYENFPMQVGQRRGRKLYMGAEHSPD